ncbi:NADH:flavin oxidoreductase [Pseudomonas syringae]|uniref:NADH:flavin oxidoreductase/NADH oxidase N-terminal domain-containing protein n=5 Tax=Pseudomonas syringae TaxID=317 RepID=A0A3M4LB78_PSESF|nr:NADH:flavin oxidoreductase [Pseudomonas syringae]EPM44498.1 NADH:flavin oxidoreductase / NADH oxidase family protein [Pseudomonas syringae pv. actinidiae ICMP 19098]EPN15601.1 NADH:flavin oxidoreductase / NADH oxidase family protein [Pseudomonas syringae pv. actinidiae ICMP 19100]EPN24002.1 NADH:flavin oxidoreductase / NADH oxidase family protein [Pseudomonas syringae pv. actinidiae ICMP 19099]EPN31377.1 NADH:flavin oxidoreductase / NADH oxidase family protein [Pseudomonas syringae pv. actin
MSEINKNVPALFNVGNLKLKNRFALAPMTRVSATEQGCATQAMARYYERFAKGGFGLIITEGSYTDRSFSQGYPFQPGLIDDEQALAWRATTDAVHRHGGAVIAQIMHAGALSQANRFVNEAAGPSAIRPKGEQMAFYYGEGRYRVPRAMSDKDIAEAIDGFARATRRAVGAAGFDGVEIHGANGYLLDQFLTDYTNQRTDQWGGNVYQRLRLTLDVIAEVKKAAGQAPVGVRVSQGKVNDFQHKWAGGERDAEVIFGALADAGVDYIHVTEHQAWQPAFAQYEASLVRLARRYAPNVALIANGGLHDPEKAAQVVRDGADIIAVGKGALANPDLPRLLLEGGAIREFDPAILGPIANIKDSEFG